MAGEKGEGKKHKSKRSSSSGDGSGGSSVGKKQKKSAKGEPKETTPTAEVASNATASEPPPTRAFVFGAKPALVGAYDEDLDKLMFSDKTV